MFGLFGKSHNPEDVAKKIIFKMSGELSIIKPKLERLFDDQILAVDLASALVSSYLFQLSDVGVSKNKQEIVKLVVNGAYTSFLGLYEGSGKIGDWVAKFTGNNSEYTDCFRFLHNKLNAATGPSDAAGAALPLMGVLYEKLTGCDIELGFKPLMAEGGQEWFNELGVICGSLVFDARDFIQENKF